MNHPLLIKKTIRERLLSGAVWAGTGKAATGLLSLGISALLARMLSAEDMGSYFLAISLLGIFALFGQLGLSQVVVRFVGEGLGQADGERIHSIVKLVLRCGVVGALFSALIFILFSDLIFSEILQTHNLMKVKWLVAVCIIVMSINGIVAESFRGLHDIKLATIFSGLLYALVLLLCLAMSWILATQLKLTNVIIFIIVSSTFSLLLAAVFLRRHLTLIPIKHGLHKQFYMKEVLSVAWPLWVTGGALFFLSQADILILGLFRIASEVAIYGAASKLLLLVALSLVIVNAVIPSIIAELYTQGKKAELEKMLRITATLAGIPAIIVLIILIFFGGSLLAFIYGDFYRGGADVLAILSIGQLVNVWAGSCGITLMMTGHQTTMMLITLVCGITVIILALTLAPFYGPNGVAVAAATGMVLQNLAMLIGVKIKTGMWTHFKIVHLRQFKELVNRIK